MGQILKKSFPVKGSDLSEVTYKPLFGIHRKLDKVTLKSYNPDEEILPWDLESYGTAWKFSVQEWDPEQSIKLSKELTTSYATNFEFNPTMGVMEKVGLKFGASPSTSEKETFEVLTSLSSDDLGEAVLTFSQPVITSMIPIQVRYYVTREITTGWLTMSIAPKRIY